MTQDQRPLASVVFEKRGEEYQGSVPLTDLALLRDDPAETLRIVTGLYSGALEQIQQWQSDVKSLRQSRTPLPASKAWELGDTVAKLSEDLEKHGCCLDGLYDHLERHAGLSRKWLGNFMTFRRYVGDKDMIPEGLRWNEILKTAKSAGQAIADGVIAEG